MDSYKNFADVYDSFMEEVPYSKWLDYIEKICEKQKQKPNLVLDLGCGTGNITSLLFQRGYDTIGIDNSPDMLRIAREKSPHVLYTLQDMRSFELYGTVDLVVSLFDSINYILSERDLLKVFKLVNNYLNPGGLFIFDINTIHNFEHNLSKNTFAEKKDNASYIWENYYDNKKRINEYSITFFVKREDKLYSSFEEVHYERGYELDEIKNLIQKAGLKFVVAYEALTFKEANEQCDRIYIIAQEQMKGK